MSESHPALPSFFSSFKPSAAAEPQAYVAVLSPLYDADAEKALAAHPPSGETRAVPAPAPEAPFPVGARVRYRGTQRLFAGYQQISVLEPGREYTVNATAGAYSVVSTPVAGVQYELVISTASKGDWVLAG